MIAEVGIMVPTFGFCEIAPSEKFAETVCDEFFSPPLFLQSFCAFEGVASPPQTAHYLGAGRR